MSDPNGRFVWYELMTTDLAAARAFYSQVVGWRPLDAQMPGMDYWMFAVGEKPVAGLMTLPEDAQKLGAPPSWIGYVAVPDIEAAAAKVTATGGTVHVPPTDIPNVGRFAIVADPQGASLGLFKAANAEEHQPVQPGERGGVYWHELFAADQASALDFYTGLFGWEKKHARDMGELGVYQVFGTTDAALGGIMSKPPVMPVAHWNYYFTVGNIDEAAERVISAGGQIVHGPQEWGVDFSLIGVDPQGAGFSLVGKR